MPARVLHFDTFAPRPGMGNPAGVVLDANGLSDATMQAIAHAVGFNETAFVLPSTRADLRLRFFTPGHEVDLCGHATVGAFVALHQHGRLPGGGFPRRLTLETAAGLLPVTVELGGGGEPVVIMAQASAQFESFAGDRAALARVLGVGPDDLRADLPLLYGSTGLWTLVVPIQGLGAMRRMKPLTAEFPSVLTERPARPSMPSASRRSTRTRTCTRGISPRPDRAPWRIRSPAPPPVCSARTISSSSAMTRPPHSWWSRARRSAATGACGCGWSDATVGATCAWAAPAASCASWRSR
jgi:PhzF family phenazine biosynthesis protein